MNFLPEKNTIKKIAPYALGTLAVGAVVGLSYFGFVNQIPASAFTEAQLATAANLGTYGTALVGTAAKIATFSAAQFAVATGYGAAFVAALSGSVFGAVKAAQFTVQQCAKFVKSTKKVEATKPADKTPAPAPASAPASATTTSIQTRADSLSVPSPTYSPQRSVSASPTKTLPSAEFTEANIVDGPRIRTPRKIHNVGC